MKSSEIFVILLLSRHGIFVMIQVILYATRPLKEKSTMFSVVHTSQQTLTRYKFMKSGVLKFQYNMHMNILQFWWELSIQILVHCIKLILWFYIYHLTIFWKSQDFLVIYLDKFTKFVIYAKPFCILTGLWNGIVSIGNILWHKNVIPIVF